MKPIQLLHATNVISRQKHRLQQDLAFVMLVENRAYDKLVEVRWAGEDKVWRTLQAEYLPLEEVSAHGLTLTIRERAARHRR